MFALGKWGRKQEERAARTVADDWAAGVQVCREGLVRAQGAPGGAEGARLWWFNW